MLTIFNPVLTAQLVTTLGRLQPGEQLLLTNTHSFPAGERVEISSTNPVQVLAAIFTVMPLAAPDQAPLQGWLADPADEAAYDLAFTVQGMAADAAQTPTNDAAHRRGHGTRRADSDDSPSPANSRFWVGVPGPHPRMNQPCTVAFLPQQSPH